MTLTLSFPPETERALKERASRQGKSIANIVVELVQRETQTEARTENGSTMTPHERAQAFLAWAASHPTLPFEADDSRESIYAGRGE